MLMYLLKVAENIDLVQAIAKDYDAGEFEFAGDAAEQKELWSARKQALYSVKALRSPDFEVWSTDVAVPLSRLSDIIGECDTKFRGRSWNSDD